MSFRRKSAKPPRPDLAETVRRFDAVLEVLEPAKAALVEALPGTRLPGRSLDEALEAFLAGAGRAEVLMPAWRRPSCEGEWTACARGLARALDLARVTLAAPPSEEIGFVGLLELVQAILDPLEPFAAADATIRGRAR